MNTKPSCLIVDDETDLSELLIITLQRMGIHAESADNLDDAKFMLRQRKYDLCLSDMRLPDGNGLDLVRHVMQHHPGLPIAVITAFGSAENAVSALKAGAFDYITKPISLQQLRPLVQSALKLSQPTSMIEAPSPRKLVGQSERINEIRNKIEQAARSQAPIHLQGEKGTGKELIAHQIHEASARRDGPFIKADCAGLQPQQIESAFFGHVKGAYSGATQDKTGYFQAANGGILYIDELTELPLATQVKLLNAIQEKKVSRLGASEAESVDVRIISATSKELGTYMLNGQFRQDLYYRLNVVGIATPTLNELREDIPLIAEHILETLSAKLNIEKPTLNEEAIQALLRHSYKGHVSELENILERAVNLIDGNQIELAHLSLNATAGKASPVSTLSLDAQGLALPDFLENIEKQAILQALEKTRQNKTAAAKLLGVSFRTLRYRLSKLGLSKDNDNDEEE